MTEFSRRLFATGIRMAGAELRRKTDWQIRQEQIREDIARLLAEQAGLEEGFEVDFASMPAGEQRRMRALADRAIAEIDPTSDAEIIAEAVAETLGWAAGLTNQAHPEDIIREALSRYKALRAAPVFTVLGGSPDATLVRKCVCGGLVYREPDGKIACDNCGREYDR